MATSPVVPPVTERHAVPDKCPGALRMFEASDGKIARVRLAGQPLTVPQAATLGAMADDLGDGHVLFTTRANVQLRGLDDEQAQRFAEQVAELGLLPSATHERTRNVVTSPLTGLVVDGERRPDLLPLAAAVDEVIQATPALAGLAGRFLIGLDDGDGHAAALPLDLTLQVHGDRLVLALGSRDPGRTYDAGALLDPHATAALVGRVCEAWLEVKDASGEDAWNVDDLSDARRAELHERVRALAPAADEQVHAAAEQPRLAGALPGAGDTVTILAKAPLASVPADGWRVACAAAFEGDGQIRVTPWHAVVIPGVAADEADQWLATLAAAGWVVDPRSPWLDVHACTGRPQCARSRADVQEHARRIVDAFEGGLEGLPVMLSGCERQCGHPSTTHHAFVATDEDEYAVFLHDGSHDAQDDPGHERVSSGQAIALLSTAGSIA